MTLRRPLLAVALLAVLPTLSLAETWQPADAAAGTGAIGFEDDAMTFASGARLGLGPAQILTNFDARGTAVAATIQPVLEPADIKLADGRELCGAPVSYIVSWDAEADTGTRKRLAFFKDADTPTSEAGACAAFSYTLAPEAK